MAEQQRSNQQKQQQQRKEDKPPRYTGGVGAVLRGSVSMIITIIMLFLISLAIEYGVSFLGLVNGGANHARGLFIEYYQYLINDHSSKTYLIDPMNNAMEAINWTSNWLGIDLSKLVSSPSIGLRGWFDVVIFTFYCFLIKMAYVFSALPLAVLIWLCMIFDGMVLREKRKAIGGRDSGLNWAISMHMIGVPLIGFMLLYLVLPLTYHPIIWLLPVIFLSGCGWRSAVINFSKFH